MVLKNATTGVTLARRVSKAETPWRRIVGWLHRSSIAADEGLLFERCGMIHTVGMRTPIDVLFLDRDLCVSDIMPQVAPGRLQVGRFDAHSVLEMAPGFIERNDVLVGDRFELAIAGS